jgi:hypothetical protein
MSSSNRTVIHLVSVQKKAQESICKGETCLALVEVPYQRYSETHAR